MATVTVAPTAPAADLIGFRQAFYGTLGRWADALFELTDARLQASAPVGSTPHLSLEGCFRRSHGSLYKALADGSINHRALRELLAAHRPAGWPAVFAVDASTWDLCDAECSPERGFYYHPSKHSAGQPIVAGWSYQWIAQLSDDADSWTAPVDARRIPVGADVTDATVEQIRELLPLLDDKQTPLFVFDAGYDPIGLTHTLADDNVQLLVGWCASATTACSTPTRPNVPREPPDGHDATARSSNAPMRPPGPTPTASSPSTTSSTAA